MKPTLPLASLAPAAPRSRRLPEPVLPASQSPPLPATPGPASPVPPSPGAPRVQPAGEDGQGRAQAPPGLPRPPSRLRAQAVRLQVALPPTGAVQRQSVRKLHGRQRLTVEAGPPPPHQLSFLKQGGHPRAPGGRALGGTARGCQAPSALGAGGDPALGREGVWGSPALCPSKALQEMLKARGRDCGSEPEAELPTPMTPQRLCAACRPQLRVSPSAGPVGERPGGGWGGPRGTAGAGAGHLPPHSAPVASRSN